MALAAKNSSLSRKDLWQPQFHPCSSNILSIKKNYVSQESDGTIPGYPRYKTTHFAMNRPVPFNEPLLSDSERWMRRWTGASAAAIAGQMRQLFFWRPKKDMMRRNIYPWWYYGNSMVILHTCIWNTNMAMFQSTTLVGYFTIQNWSRFFRFQDLAYDPVKTFLCVWVWTLPWLVKELLIEPTLKHNSSSVLKQQQQTLHSNPIPTSPKP